MPKSEQVIVKLSVDGNGAIKVLEQVGGSGRNLYNVMESIEKRFKAASVQTGSYNDISSRLNSATAAMRNMVPGTEAYERALRRVNVLQEHFNRVSGRTVQTVQTTAGGANAASQAFGQLGWVLGDAGMFAVNFRMGMMSIGNNIPMVVQGFIQAKQQAAALGVTLKSQLVSSLMGPGGVMLAVNALMLAFQVLPGLFKKSAAASAELTAATSAGVVQLKYERQALTEIFTRLKSSNTAHAEKLRLIGLLNSKYSDYTGELKNSAAALADINKIEEKALRLIDLKITAKMMEARADAIKEMYTAAYKKAMETAASGPDFLDYVVSGIKAQFAGLYGGANAVTEQVNRWTGELGELAKITEQFNQAARDQLGIETQLAELEKDNKPDKPDAKKSAIEILLDKRRQELELLKARNDGKYYAVAWQFETELYQLAQKKNLTLEDELSVWNEIRAVSKEIKEYIQPLELSAIGIIDKYSKNERFKKLEPIDTVENSADVSVSKYEILQAEMSSALSLTDGLREGLRDVNREGARAFGTLISNAIGTTSVFQQLIGMIARAVAEMLVLRAVSALFNFLLPGSGAAGGIAGAPVTNPVSVAALQLPTRAININVSGELRGDGSSLRSVINRVEKMEARYK